MVKSVFVPRFVEFSDGDGSFFLRDGIAFEDFRTANLQDLVSDFFDNKILDNQFPEDPALSMECKALWKELFWRKSDEWTSCYPKYDPRAVNHGNPTIQPQHNHTKHLNYDWYL